MKGNTEELLSRIQYLESLAQKTLATQRKDGHTKSIDSGPFSGFRSSTLSFLRATFGTTHPYYVEFDETTERYGYYELVAGIAILDSAKAEIQNGWFLTYKGLVSSEIFSDFLEMASHLLDQHYKDPAAVMIGSVLEEHLRQLCTKYGIEVAIDKDGDLIAKKADRLNSDLASKEIYNKLDQKNITAWLDLRNKAAHGKYGEYTIEQVRIMCNGVSEFLARNQL